MPSTTDRPPRALSPRVLRLLLNLYPPFVANRVRVRSVTPDFRAATLHVRQSLFTRNLSGTTFGGSIFAAADPMHAVLYWQIFAHEGTRLRIWLRSSSVRYLKPARGTLELRFRVGDDELAAARAALAADGRWIGRHRIEARDRTGEVCARFDNEVYLGLP